MRLLSKDPAERPQSGAELAERFDRLVPRTPPSGVPVLVTTTPDRAPDPIVQPTRRNPGAPPSFPPPADRRPPARTSGHGSHLHRTQRGETGVQVGTRRFGWPLIALVLLLIGLLGAALADRMIGASGKDPATMLLVAPQVVAGPTSGQYPRERVFDAMIPQGVPDARPRATEVKDA
jgi:eukaryotic-like serine/threonine-protein kinase